MRAVKATAALGMLVTVGVLIGGCLTVPAAEWDADAAVRIALNGTTASVGSATGVTVTGGVVTIGAAGTYVVSGALADGQIVVAAAKDDEVRIVLDGAEITNRTGAPLYASQCDQLIVTLADGTTNVLTDGGAGFVYADEAEKEPNAALFSKDDLMIEGTGALVVNAGFNNGIGTKDDLVVTGGDITVTAVNHGIRGNDSVTVTDGIFTIDAGNDGIQTNNETDADKGWVAVSGGTFNITAANDGIQADQTMAVTGGTFALVCGGGAAKAGELAEDASAKGIKAGGDLTIADGIFTVDSADDAIHTNGSAVVSGGMLTLATGDDGIHADGDLTVLDGTLTVLESYEGLEGDNVYIKGGTVRIVSSDDGINASDGTGTDLNGGKNATFDRNAGMGGMLNHALTISGGDTVVYAGGDGLDANGPLTVSGGKLSVICTGSSDNEALDADGGVSLTGGEIVFGGVSTGRPGTSSTQSYVVTNAAVEAGSVITVQKDGRTLMTYTAEYASKALALSNEDIIAGESYDLYNGSTKITAVTAGTGATGMGGGMGRGGMNGWAAPPNMNGENGQIPERRR